MIQNLIFDILFLKILFQTYNFFYTRPHVPVDIIRVFLFKFQIFQQKVSKSTKTSKKGHSFYNTVSLEKPYKFSSKHVSVWCQKKHLHCTISGRPRTVFLEHFESKSLYIFVDICNKSFVPQTYFHLQAYFDTSIYSIITLKFSRELGFQG